MTYEQINSISLWIAEIIVACLAICGIYMSSGFWGLVALALFVGGVVFVGWSVAKGLEIKYGDFDRECERDERRLPISDDNFFSI